MLLTSLYRSEFRLTHCFLTVCSQISRCAGEKMFGNLTNLGATRRMVRGPQTGTAVTGSGTLAATDLGRIPGVAPRAEQDLSRLSSRRAHPAPSRSPAGHWSRLGLSPLSGCQAADFIGRWLRRTLFHLATPTRSRRRKMSCRSVAGRRCRSLASAHEWGKRLKLFTRGIARRDGQPPRRDPRGGWHRNCWLFYGERSPICTNNQNVLYEVE
jgi:hypothetical protein